MKVGAGHEVITTPRTFLVSASGIVTAGAKPVFADVDLNGQNITVESIQALLSCKTEAVIVVHLLDMPAEMDSTMALSEKHGFYVIDDCAQAYGAKYKVLSVGLLVMQVLCHSAKIKLCLQVVKVAWLLLMMNQYGKLSGVIKTMVNRGMQYITKNTYLAFDCYMNVLVLTCE